MSFSKTELDVLAQIGGGVKEVSILAKVLHKSVSQIYRIAKNLQQEDILTLHEGALQPEMKTHVQLLLKMLAEAPKLAIPLGGTGIQVYSSLLEPKTVAHVEKETRLHKTTVLKKINQGRKMSLLAIKGKTYAVNEQLWPQLKEYLEELQKYQEAIDSRVPLHAIIYFKNNDQIVFSVKEEFNATKTAFSAYERYGIRLLLNTNYYCLPKKTLTKEEIFAHSLYVAEKTQETRHLLFIALFLLKHRELRHIQHPIIANINKTLSGKNVPRYPSLTEIQDKASVYEIEA